MFVHQTIWMWRECKSFQWKLGPSDQLARTELKPAVKFCFNLFNKIWFSEVFVFWKLGKCPKVYNTAIMDIFRYFPHLFKSSGITSYYSPWPSSWSIAFHIYVVTNNFFEVGNENELGQMCGETSNFFKSFQVLIFSSTIQLIFRGGYLSKKTDTLKKALVVIPVKGGVRVPKRMNFRKGSKRQLTPNPHPSEWSLSLEIMCMHFILSGSRTSLHIYDHIH